MTTTAQSIIDKAEITLQDTTNIRWSEAELLGYLNDGQEAIVLLKPDANAVIETVQLASGSIQDLPTLASTAILLMDVTNNMGTDGSTRGNAISIADRGTMDACFPGWMIDTANTTVKHVIYDSKKLPKKFWVYPQSDGTNYIEIITSQTPTAVASVGNNISIGDEYAVLLQDYILYKAFAKDAEYNDGGQRANMHLQLFIQAVNGRDDNEMAMRPVRTARGDN